MTLELKIGDALLGRVDEALIAYRDANAIAKALVANDERNTEWRHDLALTHNDIGEVLRIHGELDAALAAYREANAIAKALLTKGESNAEWRHDFEFSYYGIGQVLDAQDQLSEALAAYRDSLAIVEALIAQDPSNSQWRDERPERAEKIGDLAYKFILVGDFATALGAADQAIALASDLIFVYGNRAHELMLIGRVDEARTLYLKYRGRQKVVDEKSWETTVFQDFAEMRKAGLSHPLMAEIENRFAAGG